MSKILFSFFKCFNSAFRGNYLVILKPITTILVLLIVSFAYSQSSSATYTFGNGNTDRNFTNLPGASACPLSLTVTIPVGAQVVSVDVSYSMTAVSNAWISEQRSELRCVSPGGVNENVLHPGLGNTAGTYEYHRTGLHIANDVVGGGDIVFELHTGRTFGGTGCGSGQNYVNNHSFTVTVYYTTVSCQGVPNPGIAHISQGIGCNDIEIDLFIHADGYEVPQIGLSYQWQYSFDGVNWLDIANANNPSALNYTANSTRYFRLMLTCANSNEVSYSNIVEYIAEVCDNILISSQGTVYTCSAMFYDSGGALGNYQNNEDYTQTICSPTGHNLRFDFLDYDTEDNGQFASNQVRYDILYVYDGVGTSVPMFEFSGIQTDINIVPTVISSEECLTFRFVSNETNTRSGWEAIITCTDEINTVASQFCSSAPTICNLDGYSGNTSNFYNVERNNGQIQDFGTLFEGGLDNNSFITFVAGYETVELEILVENCHNPGGGSPMVQFAVYSGSNCVIQSLVSDPFYTHFSSNAGLQQGQHLITLTGLSVGTTYYIMVDGHSGAICDYHISAQSGIDFADLDITSATICLNESITITASGGENYLWSGPGVNNQTGESITVTPPNEGMNVYYVTITGGIPECPDEIVLSSYIFAENCCEPGSVETPINPVNAQICEGNAIPTLSVSFPPGYSAPDYVVNWYDEQTGGNLLETSTLSFVPSIPSGAGTYVYYAGVTEILTMCDSERIPVTLTINPTISPTFDLWNVYCVNDVVNLPSVSQNSFTGTWNPAFVDSSVPSAAQLFVFTPDTGQACVENFEIFIEITDNAIPQFNISDTYCMGENVSLPTISENSIAGTWSPPTVNTDVAGITEYVFISSSGLDCIEDFSISIESIESIPLIFNDYGPYCQFQTAEALPPMSLNGVSGTWDLPQINTETTGLSTYYFSPDDDECYSNLSIDVLITPNPNIMINVSDPISCYGEVGIINVSASGGTPPYFGTGDFPYPAGTYLFEITDANSCSDEETISLNQPNPLMASVTNVTAHNCATLGSISISTQGGTAPYNYTWVAGTGSTSTATADLPAGEYEITVTDNNNCSVTVEAEIASEGNVNVEGEVLSHVSCYGDDSGAIGLNITDGSPQYTIIWHNGSAVSWTEYKLISGLMAGNYYITVKDRFGCVAETLLTVNQPEEIEFSAYKEHPSCYGNNDGFIELSVVGGVEPYKFSWLGIEFDNPIFTELIDGSYEIDIIDANDCKLIAGPFILTENQETCLRIPNAFTPNGDGINDTWIIEYIHLFPDALINVYNRWGQILYSARGKDEPWDGKYNGKLVPTGSYLYTIDTRNAEKPVTGTVTVVY